MTTISSRPIQLLVLCTGNSARSILCEALINHYGNTRWRAFSAGSRPKGALHPLAMQTLQAHHIDTAGLRSKSWDEFATRDAAKLDMVITVCDDAADEACPVWRGSPLKIHWSIPDPATVPVAEQLIAFENIFAILERRVMRMTELPIDTLDRDTLQTELRKLAMVFIERFKKLLSALLPAPSRTRNVFFVQRI